MKLVALKTPAVVLVEGHHGRQWTAQDAETGAVVRVTMMDRGQAVDDEPETIEIDIEELPSIKKV
jgi:hypothetical protein